MLEQCQQTLLFPSQRSETSTTATLEFASAPFPRLFDSSVHCVSSCDAAFHCRDNGYSSSVSSVHSDFCTPSKNQRRFSELLFLWKRESIRFWFLNFFDGVFWWYFDDLEIWSICRRAKGKRNRNWSIHLRINCEKMYRDILWRKKSLFLRNFFFCICFHSLR